MGAIGRIEMISSDALVESYSFEGGFELDLITIEGLGFNLFAFLLNL